MLKTLTNKDLLKILQRSINECGELPIKIRLENDIIAEVKDCLYDKDDISIYNY